MKVSESWSTMVLKAVCINKIKRHLFNDAIITPSCGVCRPVGVSYSCSSHWRTPNELASWLKKISSSTSDCCPGYKRNPSWVCYCLLLSLWIKDITFMIAILNLSLWYEENIWLFSFVEPFFLLLSW